MCAALDTLVDLLTKLRINRLDQLKTSSLDRQERAIVARAGNSQRPKGLEFFSTHSQQKCFGGDEAALVVGAVGALIVVGAAAHRLEGVSAGAGQVARPRVGAARYVGGGGNHTDECRCLYHYYVFVFY